MSASRCAPTRHAARDSRQGFVATQQWCSWKDRKRQASSDDDDFQRCSCAAFSFPLSLPLYLASPSPRLSAGIPPCVHSTVVPRGGSRRPRLARTVRRAGVDRITRQASRARDLDDTTSAIRGRTVGRPAFTRALPFDASRKARAREGTGGRGSEREHEGEGEQSEENESCRRE